MVDRKQSFLDDLSPGVRRFSGLLIAHSANRWALDHLLNGTPLEELVAESFEWQEGWSTAFVQVQTPRIAPMIVSENELVAGVDEPGRAAAEVGDHGRAGPRRSRATPACRRRAVPKVVHLGPALDPREGVGAEHAPRWLRARSRGPCRPFRPRPGRLREARDGESAGEYQSAPSTIGTRAAMMTAT